MTPTRSSEPLQTCRIASSHFIEIIQFDPCQPRWRSRSRAQVDFANEKVRQTPLTPHLLRDRLKIIAVVDSGGDSNSRLGRSGDGASDAEARAGRGVTLSRRADGRVGGDRAGSGGDLAGLEVSEITLGTGLDRSVLLVDGNGDGARRERES